jgi:hypothetical protein
MEFVMLRSLNALNAITGGYITRSSSQVRGNYNLYQLRSAYLRDVTRAFIRAQHIDEREAREQAEGYIATAFHRAVLETTWRRLLWRMGTPLLGFSAGAVSVGTVATAGDVSAFHPLLLGLNVAGSLLCVFGIRYGIPLERELYNQLSGGDGYWPSRVARGDKRAYLRAERRIKGLIDNSRQHAERFSPA